MAEHREQQGVHSRPAVSLEERRARRRAAHASQTFAAFIQRLCERGGMSPAVARRAAVSVLCAVEQRINGDETRDLEAQLPRRLSELLHRCERHEDALPGKFGREDLLRRVGEDLSLHPDAVEPVVRAVLNSVRDHISEGEAEDVMAQLPEDLRELWRHPV